MAIPSLSLTPIIYKAIETCVREGDMSRARALIAKFCEIIPPDTVQRAKFDHQINLILDCLEPDTPTKIQESSDKAGQAAAATLLPSSSSSSSASIDTAHGIELPFQVELELLKSVLMHYPEKYPEIMPKLKKLSSDCNKKKEYANAVTAVLSLNVADRRPHLRELRFSPKVVQVGYGECLTKNAYRQAFEFALLCTKPAPFVQHLRMLVGQPDNLDVDLLLILDAWIRQYAPRTDKAGPAG